MNEQQANALAESRTTSSRTSPTKQEPNMSVMNKARDIEAQIQFPASVGRGNRRGERGIVQRLPWYSPRQCHPACSIG